MARLRDLGGAHDQQCRHHEGHHQRARSFCELLPRRFARAHAWVNHARVRDDDENEECLQEGGDLNGVASPDPMNRNKSAIKASTASGARTVSTSAAPVKCIVKSKKAQHFCSEAASRATAATRSGSNGNASRTPSVVSVRGPSR